MERTRTLNSAQHDTAAVVLFAALPGAMVLWDVLTGANTTDALWLTPTPVLAALICLVIYALATRAPWRAPLVGAAPRVAFVLGVLAVALATLQAHQPVYALIKLGDLGLTAALALALTGLILRQGTELGTRLVLAFVFGVAVALPLVALARAAGWPEGLGKLALPGFTHIRIMGLSLALSFVAGACIWSAVGRVTQIGLFVSLTLIATALFWSGGRGAFLALGVLPALSLWLPTLRSGLKVMVPALGLGLGFSLLIPQELAELGLAGRFTNSATGSLGSGRIEMWQTLLTALAEQPLTGRGYAQTHWIFSDAGHGVAHLHAHNIILDTALGLGLPGAALAFLLAGWVWLRWLARARASGDVAQATGVAMVASFGVLGLVDGSYFYYQGLMPLALGAALVLAESDPETSRRTS